MAALAVLGVGGVALAAATKSAPSAAAAAALHCHLTSRRFSRHSERNRGRCEWEIHRAHPEEGRQGDGQTGSVPVALAGTPVFLSYFSLALIGQETRRASSKGHRAPVRVVSSGVCFPWSDSATQLASSKTPSAMRSATNMAWPKQKPRLGALPAALRPSPWRAGLRNAARYAGAATFNYGCRARGS